MSSKKKSPLFIIFVTVFIDLVGFGIIIPLSPYLAIKFNATPTEIGWLMSVYSLMQFVFSPFWGNISDRVGRRPIILLSLFGSGASYLAFAYSTSLTGIFLSRLFAGVFAANISTAMAYIADVTPEKDRSKSMGLIGAAFGLGFILGPIIGGFAGDFGTRLGDAPPLGMNFSAIVASVLCFANFFIATRVLKETLPPEKRNSVGREKPSRFKMIYKHLRTPTVGGLIFTVFLSGLAMAHMESNLFIYVHDVFQWPQLKANLGFAYVGVIMVITQGYLIRKLLPRWGEKILLPLGLITMAVGLAGIGFSRDVTTMAIVMTLLALGYGFANPSTLGSISLLSNERQQGEIMGVTQSLSALARILGPPLGGLYYQKISPSAPFWIAGGVCLLALLIVGRILKNLPAHGKAQTTAL